MFSHGSSCSDWIDFGASVSDGTASASYFPYMKPDEGTAKNLVRDALALQGHRKGLLILGLGIHYGLRSELMKERVLLPLLRNLTSPSTPNNLRLLWAGIHTPGILKSPAYEEQMYRAVMRFNEEMFTELRAWHMPVFDTVNMTSQGLMSFDGTHYGLGVNLVKATVLLNYLLELRAKGEW